MEQALSELIKKKEYNKIQFFLKKRKILWIFSIISILYIILSYIFDLFKLINIDTYWWNFMNNISCSYLVSLMFYIMLVFNDEYNEYRKKIALESIIKRHFYNISGQIENFFQVIESCIVFNIGIGDTIEEVERIKQIKYYEIKNLNTHNPNFFDSKKDESLDYVIKKICNDVNFHLEEIKKYTYFLNTYAINIIIDIEDTHIFENVNNNNIFWGDQTIFDLTIDSYKHRLYNIIPRLKEIDKYGCFIE